ncbi:MAG: TetR/AcrR family transcriptional regulator [Anaerolineae bacterium]|nr:TetR/AcrR family transcriptional regulator [Anaerolineae bacterium]
MSPQQRAEETRIRIMEVAEACFASQGYDATGLTEVCRQAGVSKGAFYHHFSSKQALFLELLNAWLQRLDAQLEVVRADSTDVPDAILRMAQTMRTIIREQRGKLPILFEFWVKAARDPVVWEAAVAPYRRYRDYFAGMIKSGVENKALRVDDPDLVAQMLVSLAIGLLLQGLLDVDGTDWGDVALRSVSMLLHHIKGEEPDEGIS